jgi:hypothetical protein
MKYVTTQLRAFIGLFCLSFALALPAYALDSGAYLDASASQASSIQALDTSLELKAQTQTSTSGEENAYGADAQTNANANANANMQSKSTIWASLFGSGTATTTWKSQNGFWASLAALLHFDSMLGTSTLSSDVSSETLAQVHVEDVSANKATISWSPSKFSSVSVYYATASPVIIASTTANVSPWKLWKHESVTLKRLVPNTTYFYKVVAHTDSGTTTTAEASFKTLLK